VADDPKNKGYGFAGVKAAKKTNYGALDAWFRDKNGKNMPSHSVKEYPSMANQPSSAPVTYCLFKATNLAIPEPPPPPGSSAPPLVFDGVELLVTGPGSYTTRQVRRQAESAFRRLRCRPKST
jgi:hypothetical protein